MEKEIHSKGKTVLAIGTAGVVATISSATTTYGPWIDTAGYNSLEVGLSVAITSPATISAVFFQEADASNQSDAATSDVTKYLLFYPTQLPLTVSTTTPVRIGCVSKKRYVRLALTSTGTAGITAYGIGELNNSVSQPSTIYASTLTTAQINAPSTEADSLVTSPKRTS